MKTEDGRHRRQLPHCVLNRAGKVDDRRLALGAVEVAHWNHALESGLFISLEAHMARAVWKRPGSPIGKKEPRKTKPKNKQRTREPWSAQEVRELRALAKGNTPTGVISLKLQRPPAAIRSKAQREGISLKPANRSPYSRRKRGR